MNIVHEIEGVLVAYRNETGHERPKRLGVRSRFGRLRTLAASHHVPDQILASLLIRHIRQPNSTNGVGREIKCLSVLGVRKNPVLAATPQ